MIRIRRGLDLPIAGEPEQSVAPAPPAAHVALLGEDYVGLRPRLAVRRGDAVRLGQLLFTDKGTGVRFTSPGAGEVVAIHRGERRRLLSVVVRLEGDDRASFRSHASRDPAALDGDAVREQLVESGLWTALRARPFGRIPAPDAAPPASLFVTAIDTEPLAPLPERALEGREADFVLGLQIVGRLTEGPLRLCVRRGSSIPGADVRGVRVHEFLGPHPAGLPGTHIHLLDPVGRHRTVWHVGYQDVAAIGRMFRTGTPPTERVVALAGPMVERPRLVRTRLGASLDDLLAGSLTEGPRRVVSGSVLSGRRAEGATAFLGRYDRQVSVLSDARERRTLSWLRPGGDRFSILPIFASAFRRRRRMPLDTALGGEPRAIVPLGVYERVMPLDILPTPLFKALAVGDVERATELGCLELVEEDLALCSFVCPSKSELGAWLRAVLTTIEKEG